MKKLISTTILTFIFSAFLLSCNQEKSNQTEEVAETTLSTNCETQIQTVETPINGYQALCKPEAGPGRFYRIEGLSASTNNRYFYLILGDSDANLVGTNTTPSNTAGSGKFTLTVGQSSSSTPWTFFNFSGNATTQYTYPLYTSGNGPSTICLEITDTVPPQITFWANGLKTDGSADQSGTTADANVDCGNTSSLTRANAIFTKVNWTNIGSLNTGSSYIKSNGADTVNITKGNKVYVSSQSVIGATDICATTPGSGTTELCKPSFARTKHFRIEGLQTSIAHSAATLYSGFSSQPSGGQATTTNGQASFIFYHGNGAAPAPQTSVAFSAQSGALGTDFGTAYTGFTSAASDICFDISDASPPRITLWATGVNSADCKSLTTLTATNSILNKNDWTTVQALNNTNHYLYRGSSVAVTKVTSYATTLGTGF